MPFFQNVLRGRKTGLFTAIIYRRILAYFQIDVTLADFFSATTDRFIHGKITSRIMSHKEAKKAAAPKNAKKN